MSRSIKVILIILVILLVAGAAGGAWYYFIYTPPLDIRTPEIPEPIDNTPIGKPVEGPIALPNYYFALKLPYVDVGEESNLSTSRGLVKTVFATSLLPLKDKDIASKIDESVRARIDDIAQYPEKYGIFWPDDTKDITVSVRNDSCFNNIATYQITYTDSNKYYYFGVNFDLNTGCEIALSDVFTDNSDYDMLIGKYHTFKTLHTADQWEPYYDYPYTGFNPNKAFMLSSSSISFGNPSTRYWSYDDNYGYGIDYNAFEGDIAIFDRFILSDDSLFDDSAQIYYYLISAPVEFKFNTIVEEDEDLWISCRDIEVSGLPPATIAAIDSVFETNYQEFEELYLSAKAEHDENGRYVDFYDDGTFYTPTIGGYRRYSGITRYSKYLFVTFEEYYHVIDWEGNNIADHNLNITRIIDADTGEVVQPEELFKNDFDYTAAALNKLAQDEYTPVYLSKSDVTLTEIEFLTDEAYIKVKYQEDGQDGYRWAQLDYGADIGIWDLALFDNLR